MSDDEIDKKQLISFLESVHQVGVTENEIERIAFLTGMKRLSDLLLSLLKSGAFNKGSVMRTMKMAAIEKSWVIHII